MKSYLVLLSSGLDSTVNLWEAQRRGNLKLALSFNYGQRAAQKEIACSGELCRSLGVEHQVVDLSFFSYFSQSSALTGSKGLPLGSAINIESLESSQESAKSVWVPNRNGVFLNVAAAFAEAYAIDVIIPGFNREEAETFPDNSQGFMEALAQSFSFSTQGKVGLECFTVEMTKSEIVARGLELGVPFAQLWPCYQNNESWCGECESCLRFARALKANGLDFEEMKNEDPAH